MRLYYRKNINNLRNLLIRSYLKILKRVGENQKTFNIMENFKNFEIENQEMIFGGEHRETMYTSSSGGIGDDIYDTDAKAIVYFPASN